MAKRLALASPTSPVSLGHALPDDEPTSIAAADWVPDYAPPAVGPLDSTDAVFAKGEHKSFYEPTSVGDFVPEEPTSIAWAPEDDLANGAQDDTTEVAPWARHAHGTDDSNKHTTPTEKASRNTEETERALDSEPRLPPRRDLGPCPALLCGSRLDKVVPLHHNQWVKIGRNPKAHLLLPDPGISRSQCSLRWDHYLKKVELKNEAATGTQVNERPLGLQRIYLEHADKIQVLGKGQSFDFLLDLRPVELSAEDPRDKAKAGRRDKVLPMQRRDRLRAQLASLNEKIKKMDADVFKKEKEFYEISTRRRLRIAELKEKEAACEKYAADTELLETSLKDSRRGWQEKLETTQVGNVAEMQPLIVKSAELKVQVKKLEDKRDELVKTFHPERYSEELRAGTSQVRSPGAGAQAAPRQLSRRGSGAEEDAFAGLSGLDEDRGARAADPAFQSDEDVDDGLEAFKRKDLFSDGPPAAKKPRVLDEDDSDDEEQTLFPHSDGEAPDIEEEGLDLED